MPAERETSSLAAHRTPLLVLAVILVFLLGGFGLISGISYLDSADGLSTDPAESETYKLTYLALRYRYPSLGTIGAVEERRITTQDGVTTEEIEFRQGVGGLGNDFYVHAVGTNAGGEWHLISLKRTNEDGSTIYLIRSREE